MKYALIFNTEEDKTFRMYKDDIFNTEQEAETFKGIEMTQMEAEGVNFQILEIIEKSD